MPGKRTRKDSDRTSASGSNGPPDLVDVSPSKGAGSSSSGSIGDERESTSKKICCFPAGCPFGEEAFSDENSMVKVICNYDGCKLSQFMHTDCFNHWEEGILNFLRSHGRARSWSEKQRRQNLWTKKGYDLAYRACACKCKHGHLRKDLNWMPQVSALSSEQDSGKKKNRKKHKDLPSLGGFNGLVRTKSKPIPNNKDNRIRHSSTSSAVSVDQGYLSASPATCEMGSSLFSPPSYHKSAFPFHNTHVQSHRGLNGFHAPSTSPLPEIPDDVDSLGTQFTLSPTSTDQDQSSPPNVFTPPLSPETHDTPCGDPKLLSDMNSPDKCHPHQKSPDHNIDQLSEIKAMSTLIDNLWRNGKTETQAPLQTVPEQLFTDTLNGAATGQTLAQAIELERMFSQLQTDHLQASLANSFSPGHSVFPKEQFLTENRMNNGWPNALQSPTQQEQRNFNTSAQVLLALRQKEQKEIEKREINKFILSMMSMEPNKTQVFSFPGDKTRQNSHTEIRLVPMRSTTFAKRYDFSLFENVVPRKRINPYHIKMEGEGYGSDDLRNFILASLSKVKCSQMNCVVCGVDMPVYDHFPLVDGTMFLSPEKNERSTRNCFKIKVEGKYEYVHAACMRCMEGLHNIVCRMCNARWEGVHHQLGSLYMFDIFAAAPCCQQRLCCKQCGGVVVDIRQGLTYFSEYSLQKACPHCHAMDYHLVRPVTTYQLMGLVFS